MSGKGRRCYDCDSFFTSYFCGYESCNCKIHGSLDVDQHERHPDTEAARCKDFTPKQPPAPPDPVQKMIRSLWPNGYRETRRKRP